MTEQEKLSHLSGRKGKTREVQSHGADGFGVFRCLIYASVLIFGNYSNQKLNHQVYFLKLWEEHNRINSVNAAGERLSSNVRDECETAAALPRDRLHCLIRENPRKKHSFQVLTDGRLGQKDSSPPTLLLLPFLLFFLLLLHMAQSPLIIQHLPNSDNQLLHIPAGGPPTPTLHDTLPYPHHLCIHVT